MFCIFKNFLYKAIFLRNKTKYKHGYTRNWLTEYIQILYNTKFYKPYFELCKEKNVLYNINYYNTYFEWYKENEKNISSVVNLWVTEGQARL